MYIPPFQLGIFVGAVGVIALEITAVLIDNYRSKKRREERIDENTVKIIAERVFNDNIDSGVSSVLGNRNSRSTKQMKNSFNVKGKV